MTETCKEVWILRGLPGMGKSTVASKLLYRAYSDIVDMTGAVCSADHYMVNEKGEYSFRREDLPQAHASCRDKFIKELKKGTNVIVVDNTNTTHREYIPYKKAAEEAGYEVHVIVVGNLDIELSFKRNVHNVPISSIERMAARWEP